MSVKFKKAVTFSYDDGVTQDIRLVEIFNRYGLKSTFNLNSELLGTKRFLDIEGKKIRHDKVSPDDVKSLYFGHEVAAHTLTHPSLLLVDKEEVIRQVEEDRKNLSDLVGYEVEGMAYPGGGVNNSEEVSEIIRKYTKIKYARTITCTDSFEPQENLYRFNPTVYHLDFDKANELADKFISFQPESYSIFYIWGHSYEFDINNTWDLFEKFCSKIAGKKDIFYGTNKEVLLENDWHN